MITAKTSEEDRPLLPHANESDLRTGRHDRYLPVVRVAAALAVAVAAAVTLVGMATKSILVEKTLSHEFYEYTASAIHVPTNQPGVPSFLNYANQGPIHVSYDKRSLKINEDRAFFLSGSLHPVRATRQSWEHALDEAVLQGLNMITLYVMWGYHQPSPHKAIDWRLPGDWELAEAIRAAGNRGLFVHIRPGPYTCAEYSYGGIPEWLALLHPDIALRRANGPWLRAMKEYLIEFTKYISANQLWAHQGGPIVLAQVENELGEEGSTQTDPALLLRVDAHKNFLEASNSSMGDRVASLQDYADWCGHVAERLEPNVTWTMCFGLTANNTLNTCNGINTCPDWLESMGDNKRIQVDQPGILTEFENGFQNWGENATQPNDYFWGRTSRNSAHEALRWFARGGTHLNYYMWWGGYNRGRMAAGGVMNAYANEGILCSSGQRHQPKYNHLKLLHDALIEIAPTLLDEPSAINTSQHLESLQRDGTWITGKRQVMFLYNSSRVVRFVENGDANATIVRVPQWGVLPLEGYSSAVLVDSDVLFQSWDVPPSAQAFVRDYDTFKRGADMGWEVWTEDVETNRNASARIESKTPFEQTALNFQFQVDSDYAWYETTFELKETRDVLVCVETAQANGFVAYIDGVMVGSGDTHNHKEGNATLPVNVGVVLKGNHTLSLLSESFGYGNLVGRWGGSTSAKQKGIVGNVTLFLLDNQQSKSQNVSLVDGRNWSMHAGLHREYVNKATRPQRSILRNPSALSSSRQNMQDRVPLWSSTWFRTPEFLPTKQSLFLKTLRGRGHFWLNGVDLGRYWNITREGQPDRFSQEYYQLPFEFLTQNYTLNELVIFDVFGSRAWETVELVLSGISASSPSAAHLRFPDEVDFAAACI